MSNNFGTAGTAWGGVWSTDLGIMVLNQEGSKVYGIREGYRYGKYFKVEGTVSGSVLKGQITGDEEKIDFEFSIYSDGKSFTGKYRTDQDPEWLYNCRGMKKK